jgi:hypothetical protein
MLLGMYPKELEIYLHIKTCTEIATLFTIAQNGEITQISMNCLMNKQNVVYPRFYLLIKRKIYLLIKRGNY